MWYSRSCTKKDSVVRVCLGAFYALSIIGSLLIYGLWQERIMTHAYGQDYFSLSVFLVFFNRVFGIVFAVVMILIMGESHRCHASVWKYFLIAASTVTASICQYEALKYVSFTVQVLGKSVKMMPVMLWGRVIFSRRYRVKDWIVACGITAGVVWFLLTGNVRPEHNNGNTWYGIMLLFIFNVLDGFTSTFQEKLFVESLTTKYNQMLYINLTSSVLSAIILAVSGKTAQAFRFCWDHPAMYGDASILSAAAVVAQWFIYTQVQEFGALTFAATMNMRQVVSVLGSYAVYHHHVTAMQVVGLCIVGASLSLQLFAGYLAERAEKTTLLRQQNEEAGLKSAALPIPGVKGSLAVGCMACFSRV